MKPRVQGLPGCFPDGVSETIRVAEEHLAIHGNPLVMNGELVLYPQMHPF